MMKKHYTAIIILLSLASLTFNYNQVKSQVNNANVKYSKVRLFLNTIDNLRILQQSGISVENIERSPGGGIILILNRWDLVQLDKHNYSYEILVDDMAAHKNRHENTIINPIPRPGPVPRIVPKKVLENTPPTAINGSKT